MSVNEVDYISMHSYYYQRDSLDDFFACYNEMDKFIKTIKATADYVLICMFLSIQQMGGYGFQIVDFNVPHCRV